ncbi:hypothetical protein, partial [Neisseria dentiae]|uniref:hypothetical protein n=1 Tax=Neisseria dentiae TaxID=194197 RepID=UPI0027DFBB89
FNQFRLGFFVVGFVDDKRVFAFGLHSLRPLQNNQFKPENVRIPSFPRRRESSLKTIKYFISITYKK